MNTDNALRLMKAYFRLRRFIDSLENVVGMIENKDIDYFDNEITDIILNLLDVPEDRTVEEENGYCRDWHYDRLYAIRTDEECERFVQEILSDSSFQKS